MQKSYNTVPPATDAFASFWSAEDSGNLINVDATAVPEQQPKEEPQTPQDIWSWDTEDDDGGDSLDYWH